MKAFAALVVAVPLSAAAPAGAGDLPGAVVMLEELSKVRPDDVPEAAPPRFVLLEDGQVFVGGSGRVLAGRLSPAEAKAFDKRLNDVRKLPGLAGTVRLGAGDGRRRLLLRRGRPLDMSVVGDPAQAAPALRPLAALIEDLSGFDHPSLRPYEAASYAVTAREATLPGGCRSWPFKESPAESIFAPRIVPGDGLRDWPTGSSPASVCVGDKTYVVALRPLLPGEHP